MAAIPYMTSTDLINSVKRKIAFPISQNTFLNLDVLAFANEEMFISQVPSVLLYHEEYFVHYDIVPLQANLSKYPIPNRATGMKLRDLFYQDVGGNIYEMTRIEEHDKAFFQANSGSNSAIHKFYIEGNDVVLAPGITSGPTGSLVFVYYLRPNQLVKNDRAATIVGFNQQITINNSLIAPLDTISLGSNIFTAVNTLGGTITAISALSTSTTQVTCTNHQLSTGQTVIVAGSNSNPVIDGSWVVTVVDANHFNISTQIATAGTAGTFTSNNQFQIGASNNATAANLNAAINASKVITSSSVVSNVITLLFPAIAMTVTTSRATAFIIPQTTLGVQFSSLPSTYTDQETNITENLFVNNALVDFLQTKPGHRTFVFDVQIPAAGITGSSIYFPTASLLIPSGSVNNTLLGAGGISTVLANIQVGDYMCLSNECIIPQIPPDLHNGLAERTSARILAAIGDQAGLQAANAKIAEIEQRQGNLLDNRSEGTPQKVVNRHSTLRYGAMGTRRRL